MSPNKKALKAHFAALYCWDEPLTRLKQSNPSPRTNRASAFSSNAMELLTLYNSWLTNSACNKTACRKKPAQDSTTPWQRAWRPDAICLAAWCLTVHRCSLLLRSLVFIHFIPASFSSLMDQRSNPITGRQHTDSKLICISISRFISHILQCWIHTVCWK